MGNFSNATRGRSFNNYQDKVFNQLNKGDIVLVQRVYGQATAIRPYLVISKDDNHIFGYCISNHNESYFYNHEVYPLNKNSYGLRENSWANLTSIKTMPKTGLIKKIASLSNDDLMMIEKRLQIQRNRQKRMIETFNIPFTICEGDVITDGVELYYVSSTDNISLSCYLLTSVLQPGYESFAKVTVDKMSKYIYFDKHIAFYASNTNIKIIDIATIREMLNIDQAKIHAKKAKKEVEEKEYDIGTIFRIGNDGFVFLYKDGNTLYGVNLLSYKAFLEIVPINVNKAEIAGVCSKQEIDAIVKYLVENAHGASKKLKQLYR